MPGRTRDSDVCLDDGLTAHGLCAEHLSAKFDEFQRIYNHNNFHGDEKIMAVAASHHRFSCLHPFRDGNGRVIRSFSGLCLALSGINRSNLWSLSLGFSRDKQWYMTNLRSADSPCADGKLLKALFLQGAIPRSEVRSIMGMEKQTDRRARRIVSQLTAEGLVQSGSSRAPLRIGIPTQVLRYYFPDRFDPSVMGENDSSIQPC
jgi:Fic/DOC family